MDLANWLQSAVFVAKYCRSMFLQKNGSLGERYRHLVVDWSVTVCDCKGDCVWRGIWAWVLWRNVLGSVTGKSEIRGGVKQTTFKRLDYIKCFNVR